MCHWPEKFHGDKVAIVPEYASDEKNTSASTHLTLHIGGGQPQLGLGAGIHWHTSPDNEIEYVAKDETRQEIPYVRLKSGDKIYEFCAPEIAATTVPAGERRRMDCVDCHNRPTHAFFATPERAVDAAMATGAISPAIPFARQQAVEALKATYPDRAAAENAIATRLRAFYADKHAAEASGDSLDRLVRSTQALYARNVFPAMNVSWGTHPNNLGHTDAPGCFRCHDDQHKTAEGRVIRQDCEMCHTIQ
jgi:hypothetical protein